MTRKKIKQELGELLGHKVSDDFLEQCIIAYNSGRHGSVGLGGYATLVIFLRLRVFSNMSLKITNAGLVGKPLL